jgi:hypothetical protein
MSNNFQPWSEIEDDILLQELEENKSINEIAKNHKRTVGAINMRIGTIAYQLALDNVDVNTIMGNTRLKPTQLYSSINKHPKTPKPIPIPRDNSIKYTYSILFYCDDKEILRENGVLYNLLLYCENNCMKVVNSIRIKKELDELLDGGSCFCNIQLLNDKNEIIREAVNIKYPFKRDVDGHDLLSV